MASKKKKVIISSAARSPRESVQKSNERTLVFGKETYKWIGVGIALIFVGMLLMIGGFNENPNVFDESQLYSFRRTFLASVVILAGLVVNIYALFK